VETIFKKNLYSALFIPEARNECKGPVEGLTTKIQTFTASYVRQGFAFQQSVLSHLVGFSINGLEFKGEKNIPGNSVVGLLFLRAHLLNLTLKRTITISHDVKLENLENFSLKQVM
jgi:hypothetical protein